MKRKHLAALAATACASAALVGISTPASPADASQHQSQRQGDAALAASELTLPKGYKHLVVIYEENHSFDNLYGKWGRVGGDRIAGIPAKPKLPQIAQNGTLFHCLLQDDVNLTSPTPLPTTCQDPARGVPDSAFRNKPFEIDNYIKPESTTCPPEGTFAPNGVLDGTGEPGGCTRDLVHRFYNEQFQINGGAMNRYVLGSDAAGLSMGYYDTKQLPIYKYLHRRHAPKYVIADHFFQAAFGGSFLNHQFLIAARAPLDTDPNIGTPDAPSTTGVNSVLDANGMPTSTPLYTATGTVADKQLTQKCGDPTVNNAEKACGNFAVNTIQPESTPHGGGAVLPKIDDSQYPNIGDELTDADVSWKWYSGGWADADAGHPGALFQYHHQPFNYFANYAPGQPGRHHLQDETAFFDDVRDGHLPKVSFVKPYGAENEHPGYASEPHGSDHLVHLLKSILKGPQAKRTLVVVTYDEFGGTWDHVSPPNTVNAPAGTADAWGPGTRIPALILSRSFRSSGVDHTTYDTTSILATIEHSYGLDPLSSRDAAVNDLGRAVSIGTRRSH